MNSFGKHLLDPVSIRASSILLGSGPAKQKAIDTWKAKRNWQEPQWFPAGSWPRAGGWWCLPGLLAKVIGHSEIYTDKELKNKKGEEGDEATGNQGEEASLGSFSPFWEGKEEPEHLSREVKMEREKRLTRFQLSPSILQRPLEMQKVYNLEIPQILKVPCPPLRIIMKQLI